MKAWYSVEAADSVACHNQGYCGKFGMIETLKPGGTFVLDSAESADLDELMPRSMRCFLAEKRAKIFRIDASALAKKLGMPGRINMIIQTPPPSVAAHWA